MNAATDVSLVDKSTQKSTTKSTTKKFNIALLGYRSHPYVGGQGIYLKYLSRALAAQGHTVHVYSGQPYPKLDDNITLIKVPSLDLYATPNHLRALKWKHFLSFSDIYEWWTMATGGFGEPYTFGRRVFKKLKHANYDIIHDNQSLCTGLLKLQTHGHTVVSTIHHPIHRDRELALEEAPNTGMRLLVKRWHSFLNMQERVVKKLKHVITVSEQSQRDIAHYFKRATGQTPVIFNGVDTQLFRPLNHIKKQSLTLLTTSSSDHPLKGLSTLLHSVHDIKQTHPDIKLHVIGELKQGGANEKRIKQLNLENNVHFFSKISDQALVEKYNEASIVVCPSLYEGFGLPAAEALACGCAVISSDGGALPEVIGDAGIVFPAGDHQKLSAAIRSLLSDHSLSKHFSDKARMRSLTHFCWTRVATELSQHYERIIEA